MKLAAKLSSLVGIKVKLLKGIKRVRHAEGPTHPQQNGVEGD